MKSINLAEVSNSISADSWNFFREDQTMKSVVDPEDRAAVFIVALVGNYVPGTIDGMRKLGKALDKIDANRKIVELSDEESSAVKQAFDKMAGTFGVGARGVVLAISEAFV